MIVLATVFVIAQSLDLATYLMAPYNEQNLVPSLIVPVSVFVMKIAAVIAILAGAALLRYRSHREQRPLQKFRILQWAKAVLLVGSLVAFASFGLNVVSLSL